MVKRPRIPDEVGRTRVSGYETAEGAGRGGGRRDGHGVRKNEFFSHVMMKEGERLGPAKGETMPSPITRRKRCPPAERLRRTFCRNPSPAQELSSSARRSPVPTKRLKRKKRKILDTTDHVIVLNEKHLKR